MINFHLEFSLLTFSFSLLVVVVFVVVVVSFFLHFFFYFFIFPPISLLLRYTYKLNGRLLELFHRNFGVERLLLKTSGLT